MGVKLFLHGHYHNYSKTVINDIQFFNASYQSNSRFSVLTIDEEHVEIEEYEEGVYRDAYQLY